MLAYKDIQYALKKSDRKTTSIFIERDGTVSVIAPEPYDMEKVERVLEAKRSWIYRHIAEWDDLNRTRVVREFVSGEGFPYLGSSYRLKIEENKRHDLRLKSGVFVMSSSVLPDARTAFVEFYRSKAKERIPKRVCQYAKQMGLTPTEVRIHDLKNRWASCSPGGALNFHWRCMMAPLTALDYIIVHELAHIEQPNHTAKFWDLIEKVLPEYQQPKGWLRLHGAGLGL